MEKALFVPLKTEYYEAFERGDKTYELRLYGKRWNEKTCRVGRAMVLSKGYGKQNRINTFVKEFNAVHGSVFNGTDRDAIFALYGTLDVMIAQTHVDTDRMEKVA